MKFIFAFFIFCLSLFGLAPFALAGGSIAGNGGGLAEKNVLYADLNLNSFIELCLQAETCVTADDEKRVLGEISVALKQERARPDHLQFLSGRSGEFLIDGQIRVAKTGDQVGDPVFVNTDLLYTKTASGQYQAMDLALASSMLIHEYGHHHTIKEHIWLDRLGSRLQTFLLKQSVRSEIWNGEIEFTVVQENLVRKDADKSHLHAIDEVLISYGNELVNLTGALRATVHCPQPNAPIVGLRIYNLHGDHGVTYDPVSKITRKPMNAWYILSCATGEISDTGDLEFTLALKRKPATGAPDFDLASSRFRQISCRTDRRVCN